jgi:hypothetical protein
MICYDLHVQHAASSAVKRLLNMKCAKEKNLSVCIRAEVQVALREVVCSQLDMGQPSALAKLCRNRVFFEQASQKSFHYPADASTREKVIYLHEQSTRNPAQMRIMRVHKAFCQKTI